MKRVETEPKHYQTFEDLEVYQVAREFRKAMYQVATRLPGEEKFALASQIRRAAVSVTNNIAEGHGRFHFLDQIKFTLQARGSLEELLDDLNVCIDQNYWPLEEIEKLKSDGWRVHQMINGYIRFLRSRIASESPRVRESPYDEVSDALSDRFNSYRFNTSTNDTLPLQRFSSSTFPNGRAKLNTYHSPLDDLTEKDPLPVISQTPRASISYPAIRLGQSAQICAICGPFNE